MILCSAVCMKCNMGRATCFQALWTWPNMSELLSNIKIKVDTNTKLTLNPIVCILMLDDTYYIYFKTLPVWYKFIYSSEVNHC